MLRRGFHSASQLWQQPVSKLGKGKKLPPNKQRLVILNAKESNLIKKMPRFYDHSNANKRIINTVEFEQERSKLTKINSKLTNEQALRQLNIIKPTIMEVSLNRYEQIQKEISTIFTLVQLRDYIQENYPDMTGYKSIPKRLIIPKILNECWNLKVSENVNPEDDLVIQREFDLNQRELYLLLVQRTFDKWIRANVKIIVSPEELRVVIRSNKSHLQYIELALEKILKNIVTDSIELKSIKDYIKTSGKMLPIDEIQQLSGVFLQNEISDDENNFKMYSLGGKKFFEVKRLILWSLENNSFIKDLTLTNFDNTKANDDFKFFQNYQLDSLPWLYKDKIWSRLQKPKTKNASLPKLEINPDEVYELLQTDSIDDSEIEGISSQSITAVSFGQVLHELNDDETIKKSILNTEIPFIKDRLKSLPLYQFDESSSSSMSTSLDEIDPSLDVSQDYHNYFAQIKYMPSPFQKTTETEKNSSNIESFLSNPPLEIWFEIDENEKIKMDSLQVVLIKNEMNSTVLLPAHLTDLKFIKSDSINLIDPNFANPSSNDWLSDQPGIKRHLSLAKLDFNGKKTVKVPDYVDVNIPGVEEPVRYDYVSLSYRRHLNYKFNDKLLQYAVIEGGSLGGRTSELIMVDNEAVDNSSEITDQRENFKKFVGDVTQFVEEFEIFANKPTIQNDDGNDLKIV